MDCFEYEKEYMIYDYDPDVAEQIFVSEEAFKEYVMGDKETQFIYQLPNNDMVVVVC